MQIPEELIRAAEFHTHLGPFLVIGLRIGGVIVREFGDEPFTIKIRVLTGRKPPYSCLADGIQLSTPCTTGNGGMEVAAERKMAVEATKGDRTLSVSLRREVFDRIENECSEDDQHPFALEIWEMPEKELLVVSLRADGVVVQGFGDESSAEAEEANQ